MDSVPRYRTALEEYIRREARPVDKYGHQPRLYALARLVGAGREYDDDVVHAAAWLHDLGVFEGHRPSDPEALARWDNVVYAVEHAPDVLSRAGFPAEKTGAVLEVIRTHQPSAVPATVEAEIVRDADILEQLGAIGIVRAVAKIGRDTRYPTFTAAAAVLEKSLAELPAKLRTENGRALAKPKIRALEQFLRALSAESYDALF